MGTRLRSWWQKIKRHPFIVSGIIGFIVLIFSGYWFHWSWTGFNKTLWDWMQLLIIPVALALVAIWFNRNERINEQKIASDNRQESALQAYLDRLSELLMKERLRTSKPEDEVRIAARARTLTILRQLDEFRKVDVIKFLYESDLISVDADKCVIDLAGANLREASFFLANLSRVNLIGVELNFAEFTVVDLTEANLTEADLIGVAFIETDLNKATLCDANLCYAKLNEANLSGANFSKALLSRADLSEADLSEAKLNEADLSEAKLIRSNLERADLSEAELSRANLRGANLKDATGITIEELEKQAKSLKGATMPDGSIHP
jgi:uncharacterized protein YjbI with pentapeptide repeats